MSSSAPVTMSALAVEVEGPWSDRRPIVAGQPFELLVRASLAESARPVRLLGIDRAPSLELVTLDLDLFHRQVELQPGEHYVTRVTVTVPSPCEIDLQDFYLLLDGAADVPLAAQPKLFEVEPDLAGALEFEPVPLCQYGDATKIRVVPRVVTGDVFENVTLNFGPEQDLYAGKRTLHLPRIGPDATLEPLEIVLRGRELEISLAASHGSQRVDARRTVIVPEPDTREASAFRFLEPKKLSKDTLKIVPFGASSGLTTEHGQFPLRSGRRYRVTIDAHDPAVHDIDMRELPGAVHVLRESRQDGGESHVFLIDVVSSELFTRSDRLFYDTKDGTGEPIGTGEIHIAIAPRAGRHWGVAAAVGLAPFGHSLLVLATELGDGELMEIVQAWREFLSGSGAVPDREPWVFVIGFITIPLTWGALQLFDWIKHRWSD